jgi:hypothetical protein
MRIDARFEVLSALLDREPVEADVLHAALDDPEGRAELVDFVRLRAEAQRAFAVEEQHEASPVLRATARTWLARAAAALVALSLGAAGGAWWMDQRERRPPSPTHVVRFVPGVDWK